MRLIKIIAIILVCVLPIILITNLGCPIPVEEEAEAEDGTITVRLINATDATDDKVYVAIFPDGVDPSGDTWIAKGDSTVDALGGATISSLVDPSDDAWTGTGGKKYDIFLFVDTNGSGSVPEDDIDMGGITENKEVDGDITVTVDYDDLTNDIPDNLT